MVRAILVLCWAVLAAGVCACDQEPDLDVTATLDVLVDGIPRSKVSVGDVEYVVGRPGQEFEIRVSVSGGIRYEAVVLVDGVDTVNGGLREGSGLITTNDLIVRGFRQNHREVVAFEFTSPGNSVAASLGSMKRIGEIQAVIYLENPEYRSGDRVLYAHKNMKSFGSYGEGPGNLGTGAGRRIYSPIGFASHFVRTPGPPAFRLVLRYDDRTGLCRRGIERYCDRILDW